MITDPAAFPCDEMCERGLSFTDYAAIRLYIAIFTQENWDVPIRDSDVKEDPEGVYAKHGDAYIYSGRSHEHDQAKRYSTVFSPEQRVAREAYRLARVLLEARSAARKEQP